MSDLPSFKTNRWLDIVPSDAPQPQDKVTKKTAPTVTKPKVVKNPILPQRRNQIKRPVHRSRVIRPSPATAQAPVPVKSSDQANSQRLPMSKQEEDKPWFPCF